jgi:hypothetical protein
MLNIQKYRERKRRIYYPIGERLFEVSERFRNEWNRWVDKKYKIGNTRWRNLEKLCRKSWGYPKP